jgi:hypothetical protein
MVMKTAGNDNEYTDTMKKTFGPGGWYVGMTVFVIMLFIPIILYVNLIAQFLFPILLLLIESISGKDKPESFLNNRDVIFDQFSYTWTVFIVFGILMLLTVKKDMAIFIKLTTYGVIFTIGIIVFVVAIGFQGLSRGDFKFVLYRDNVGDPTDPPKVDPKKTEILLFGSDYSHL